MNRDIAAYKNIVDKSEKLLYDYVIKLNNHMNECECDEIINFHNFNNRSGHGEPNLLCLECGGYIEPLDIYG